MMNDADMRRPLRQVLDCEQAADPETRIVEEMCIHSGAARIDVAVINGVLHGYELKSDRDTLDRLSEQAESYCAVFDQLTLVVGERHVRNAAELVPDWWGITVARYWRGNLLFRDLKRSQMNPSLDPVSIAELLWRDEALKFLSDLDSAEGMRSKPKSRVCEKLAEVANLSALRDRVRHCLKARLNQQSALKLQSGGGLALPESTSSVNHLGGWS
jgi:hypothetical protein